MSIGQPCKYCTHGKMRSFHFCWDQAVILCDNSKCKSILYTSPSQCIIKSNTLLPAHQPISGLDQQNLLSDGSGGSSSGVYSEARSFLPSPAQSRKSGTDEEVELLLKAAFSPLNFEDLIDTSCGSSGLVTHTQVSPKRHTARSNSSNNEGFFELLNGLDLEIPTQLVKTESHSKSSFVETGLDVVTTEFEGRMKDFELPLLGTDNSGIAPSGCQQPPNEILRTVSSGGCQQLPGEILMGVSLSGQQSLNEVLKVESVATTRLQGPCIPSQRSAFSSLDASNEESASFINSEQNSLISSFSCHSSSSEKNETSEYLIQHCESSYFSVPFTNEFMIENMSAIPTRFMSPTVSALSEDSGYNEEDGKASSGLELAGGEENLKVSSKTFAYSSKHVDDTTKDIFTKQPHQSNFKELIIQTNLDWPLMSDSHTLIVLPAMVTTDNNLTDSPQELSTLPSITQTTRSEEICTTPQDERETISLSNEQLEGGSLAPAEQCEDNEHGTMFSENHDPTLEEESHGVSISEPFNTSVISQPSECIISEGSSHSTFSEPKNESENYGNSTPSLDTLSGASLCPGEHEKKRGRRPRSKHKLRSLSDHSASKSDNKHTVPDNIASRIRKGECKKMKGNRKKVIRRKSKISGFRYNEGGKQNKPSKKGTLKKACKRERSKRPIHPRSARQQTSSLENQPPTSSRENHSAQVFHESDDKRDSTTTQNPSWQIPERRTNHLSRRVTNLSPKKLLIGHVNKDPWSVAELCLEELTIEIIVQDKRKVSCGPDKAAKCDVQLQELLSLFGKKQNESEMSQMSTSDATLDFSSKVCGEMSLEKENGEPPFKGKSIEGYDSEGKKIDKDSHENLGVDNEHNVQNYHNEYNSGMKEHLDTDKNEQKDVTGDLLYKSPTGENSSPCVVIDKSQSLTKMVQKDSQPLQKGSDSEILSPQIDVHSESNEGNSLAIQIDSNNLFNEGAEFIKEHLVSNTFDGVYTSLEGCNTEKIISNDQEAPLGVKQCIDKPQTETSSDSVTMEDLELPMEKCVIEKNNSVPCSIEQDFIEKLTFESINKKHIDDLGSIDDYDSALNLLKISEYESPWFEKVCDKSLLSEVGEEVTEKQHLDNPVIYPFDVSGNIEVYNNDTFLTTSPEPSPQYFLNPPKFGLVRSWIGFDDTSQNEFWSKENIGEKHTLSESCTDSKSDFSSSKYFQSLVEGMDFDENFLQCPVHEHCSETFSEHLKGSLFFGETRSNSPCDIEVPEVVEPDFIYKDYSESNSTSKPFFQMSDQHLAGSVTSAPLVPLPSNIAQVPITSVPINISSCNPSSITANKSLKEKVFIIPNNPKARCILTLPSVINSFDKTVLSSSRPKISSESLILQTSMPGSSKEVINVGGKKHEVTSELLASEWEIDTSDQPMEQKLNCGLEFEGTSSLGDERKEGNLSDVEFKKSDGKSKKISALSDSSSQDTVDKESRLDILFKSKLDSTSFIANFTEIPYSPSNTVSLVQTSSCHCSAKVNETCITCNCNSRNFEDKAEITVLYNEQTEDTFSDSDNDADKLPSISLDSDGEICITTSGTVPEADCASQEEKKYFVTSDKSRMPERYLVDDPIDQCIINNESIKTVYNLNEVKETEVSLTKIGNVGLKRKADNEDENNKKLKLLNTSSELKIEKHIHNSQCGPYMCGILDNSVPHDEHCCSSLHQDFQDFPAHVINEENDHQTMKFYTSSSKQCKGNDNESTDDGAGDILRCVAKESTENDYSVSSNAKETTTHLAHNKAVCNYDIKFGSVKASPQYDSDSCLTVEKDVNDLNFFQIDSFNSEFLASLLLPTESHVSMAEYSWEKNELEFCALQESGAGMEGKEKENIATKAPQEKELLLNEVTCSTLKCTSITNKGDDLEDQNIVPPKLLYTPSAGVISSNVGQFTTSCEEAKPLLKSSCRDNVIFNKLGSDVDYNKSNSTSVNVKPNQALRKIIVLRKSSQVTPSVSSHHSSTSKKILYFTQSRSLPSVSSNVPTKMNTGEVHHGNQHVTGATVPHSIVMLPPFHSSKNTSLQPWPVAHSSVAHSGTTNSQMISSDVQKHESLINYQISSLENPPIVVPPTLITSYGDLLHPSAQRSHTVSTSSKGSMEAFITLSNNSAHYPVTRLVRMVDPTSELREQKEDNLELSSHYGNTEESSSMLKKVKLGSKGSFYLRPTPALKNAISEMRKKKIYDKEEEETSCGYLTLPDGNPIPPPVFIPPKKSELQIKQKGKRRRRREGYKKNIKAFLEEKVKDSLKCTNKNEIPKVMVIYTEGSFHICQIDVTEDR